MFVLSSPSGAGKTTLSRMLIERDAGPADVGLGDHARRCGRAKSTAATTCSSTRRNSTRWSSSGELLEWATVFDNRYGTPRAPVEAALSAGQDVLFDIDWQGTQQLREKARADVVSVFILPPSAADLEKRLHTRAQDSDEVIRGRMSRASHEISHWAEYDYIVVNHECRRRLCRSAIDPEGRAAEARAPHRPDRVRAQSAAAAREIAESLTRRGGACCVARASAFAAGRGRRAGAADPAFPAAASAALGDSRALREASQANSMLTITPRTDNPPATMVINIGSDIGFSDTGTGGTARGMTCGLCRRRRRSRTSAFWSAGAGGGLAADCDGRRRIRPARRGRRRQHVCGPGGGGLADYRRPSAPCAGAGAPLRWRWLCIRLDGSLARIRRVHRKPSAGWRSSCAAARRRSGRLFRCRRRLLGLPCAQSFRRRSSGYQHWRPVPRSRR